MTQVKTHPADTAQVQIAASIIAAISIDIADSYALEAVSALRRQAKGELRYRLSLLQEARRRSRVSTEALVCDRDAYWDAADRVQDSVRDAGLLLDSSIKLALPPGTDTAVLVPLLRGLYVAEGVCLACRELLARLRAEGLRSPRFAVSPAPIKDALFHVARACGHIDTARAVGQHPAVRQATLGLTTALIHGAAAQL